MSRMNRMTECQLDPKLRKRFGDLRVLDSDRATAIHPNADDIKRARKGDPSRGVLAQFCRRAYSSSKVLFLKEDAYIDSLDEHGVLFVQRFKLSRGAKRIMADFDRGKSVRPRAIELLAPV